MPLSPLTGTRLREHRLAAGVRQAELAAAAGISASYLNLIEHDRRKVTPQVLDRLATALSLDPVVLTGGRDVALLEDLRAAAALGGPRPVELERTEEFLSRFPGWAALLVALAGQVESLKHAIDALNDRMSHDPHLSQSLHEVLSSLTAVRATATILAESPDLSADWAARFHANLHADTERLAMGAEALVTYLDAGTALAEQGIAAPQEEVEDWLSRRGWQFSAAELASGLADEVAGLASGAARSLAQGVVRQAARDAEALPDTAFFPALEELGPDPFALADRLAADPMVVFRRLAGVAELQTGLVTCDGSGTLTLRKPVPGFPLPRFGAACPLWPLYTALGQPQRPIEVRVEIAGQSDRQFRVMAWGVLRHPQGLRGPVLREAAMLIRPIAPGGRADGLVGSGCRVCPQPDCPARREPSIMALA
jgi:transcriptional regulator with XRE-family HTH domain